MKNFIVMCATTLLMLVFILQSPLDTINNTRIEQFNELVNRATEQARFDGYFTDFNINELKSNILAKFPNLSEGEIIINVTTTPKYRTNEFDEREVINFEIGVPIKKIIALNTLVGISDFDNQYIYKRSGYVLSEVLMP